MKRGALSAVFIGILYSVLHPSFGASTDSEFDSLINEALNQKNSDRTEDNIIFEHSGAGESMGDGSIFLYESGKRTDISWSFLPRVGEKDVGEELERIAEETRRNFEEQGVEVPAEVLEMEADLYADGVSQQLMVGMSVFRVGSEFSLPEGPNGSLKPVGFDYMSTPCGIGIPPVFQMYMPNRDHKTSSISKYQASAASTLTPYERQMRKIADMRRQVMDSHGGSPQGNGDVKDGGPDGGYLPPGKYCVSVYGQYSWSLRVEEISD
jgi:hypothetical protein